MSKPDTEIATLAAGLPDGTVITDPAVIEGYRRDAAADPQAGLPRAVVRAGSTEDVQTVLRWANAHRVAVVARGAGSGLSGGATAVNGGIILSTERMRNVRIDTANRTAVAQPGVLNSEVKRAAAEHGLWYPPDPASVEISSIGGNAATNAGGLCCVKYGVTGDYVLGMEVVLADGTAVRLGGPRLKDVAGLSLTKLFVGSEGILGVITELTLRLIPAQPPASTVVAAFGSVQDAADAVVAITAKVRPAMLELMDHASINAVEDYSRMGLDRSAQALLLIQSDAPGAAAEEIAHIVEACEKSGATEVFATDDPEEGAGFTAARRLVGLALMQLGTLLLEDVTVPIPDLPELVAGISRIADDCDVLICVVAHAGDGNTHPVVVFDADDPDMSERARLAFARVMELAIALGGTITGEHGVGRLKRDWLPVQLGDDVMALTRRIKDAVDPHGILNPGAVLH
ncbi:MULTISPECIES: FAD-binding oxidoreductase [unclassified Mycolicibacterium]|uniref:FAD-binding oxidoreductase n=1 Tax=unclassified Mycolicibacterium TaxID=2636767 RepID=UPI0012DEB435|nr:MULTISPECIES: FAD-linked oxidase C-terminal domain-containing protein [unclassified Mycolicibacterium]MUL82663.1 FAD-binding protein [Mycolicibacterium sp. CBMA 329]MUL88998.1 FAD-binding protein [Mycolicibacterium sp. CBMA 331]MUL97565.1 FAD-binding protein [Mycolicibacterium sp. CBMA 334]MUM27184.1 FAD-binding protein [Mycolicibacterium sp. CBMA 295]MUM38514.1 FAD-binding protein [Mycolicibacterium sp. CBMA 247]